MLAPRWLVALLTIAIGLGAAAYLAWPRAASPTPESSPPSADELVAGIHDSVSLTRSSLVAGRAIAVFGIDQGVRLVLVRVVDGLSLSVTVVADHDVSFAMAPRFCLIGPYSAPDDAGLSEPCWGEPDLGGVVTERLSTDVAGHPMLSAGAALTVGADLRRGAERCDYPTGTWVLEVTVDPLVDGSPAGARRLPRVEVDVPVELGGLLRMASDTRYCGLATVIVREQGEPLVASPTP